MKEKIEKKEKKIKAPSTQMPMDRDDDVYRQLNRVSFQENFKVLIAHYKNVGNTHSLNQ